MAVYALHHEKNMMTASMDYDIPELLGSTPSGCGALPLSAT